MDSLIFSLNATAPVFLMMLLGMALRYLGWLDADLAEKLNRFVFRVPLPVMVFTDMATVDITQAWDGRLVLFCFGVTALSIVLAWAASLLLRDRSVQGEFIQGAYRSSAALLGVALIQNMYGSAGVAPMMILGCLPLYNVAAVLVLSLFGPERHGLDRAAVRRTAKGVATNPILLALLAGIAWTALDIPMPVILGGTLDSLGGISTPLGLMAMGASFDFKAASGRMGPAAAASFMKLVGFCALFLPLAAAMGFRREELAAVLIMLGSASTVSGYVMARSMGHEGTLAASVVMLTTLLSAFTITGWIWLLRALQLI